MEIATLKVFDYTLRLNYGIIVDQQPVKLVSHEFNGWHATPNVDHLKEVENSYVNTFDRPNQAQNQVSYVAYVIDGDGVVVAFGSATYFKEHHDYMDDDDAYCYKCNGDETKQKENKLWIEGLVSIKKGCGSIVLQELERRLSIAAHEYNAPRKIINVMSVNDSISFYENLGYEETCTGPRYAGTDNTRLVKAIQGYDLSNECIFETTEGDISCIATRIVRGQIKQIDRFLNFPEGIKHTEILTYFLAHQTDVEMYKNCFTPELQRNLIAEVAEYCS